VWASSRAYGAPPPARGEPGLGRYRGGPVRSTPACAGRTDDAGAHVRQRPEHPRLRGENDHINIKTNLADGAPPPARGERAAGAALARLGRSTPACAGRTRRTRSPPPAGSEHPRLRGENAACSWAASRACGAPPPARGEPHPRRGPRRQRRSTPACAGRTSWRSSSHACCAEHPRGAPPPARGEQGGVAVGAVQERSTPACAGRTLTLGARAPQPPEHPRLRGENQGPAFDPGAEAGAPPPARGEPLGRREVNPLDRSTPACAGRTMDKIAAAIKKAEHPRLRGENGALRAAYCEGDGAPPPARGEPPTRACRSSHARSTPACAGRCSFSPPARGEHARDVRAAVRTRSTPACAGRTPTGLGPAGCRTEHPRLRGENLFFAVGAPRRCGAPPPARGERARTSRPWPRRRSTPACAGRTRSPGSRARS